MRCKDDYQKCIDRIVLENNQWVSKGGNDKQVSIYFKWSKPTNEFRYCPRYSELKSVIKKLVVLYGIDKVENELNIKLGSDYYERRSNK